MKTIEILADLLLCCFRMYLWVYDPEGRFLRTNCPDDSFLELEDYELEALDGEICSLNLMLELYISAGLVLSTALEEMAKDLRGGNSPGAKLISRISAEARSKNIPMESALFEEAKRLKSKSLLRFSMLLIDNRSKGSELCSKLERERLQIQGSRLSSARAKAKIAETKLCFPLMLLLIALVAVCIAPAILNI